VVEADNRRRSAGLRHTSLWRLQLNHGTLSSKIMIGLQRHTVSLCDSNDEWRVAFDSERTRLLSTASGLIREILHVGSTAIPGLPAKPVVDMALVVSNFEVLPDLSFAIQPLGWIDRGYVREDNYLFVLESAPEFRTHHLHVVTVGSAQLEEYTVFKRALLEDPELRERYAALKRNLGEKYQGDRKAYTSGKSEFIESILRSNGGKRG